MFEEEQLEQVETMKYLGVTIRGGGMAVCMQ